MSQLDDALRANVLRNAVRRLRAHVEVADVTPLSIRAHFFVISAWCRIGFPPTMRADSSTDLWDLLRERIRWLNPTDWLSIPAEDGAWLTIRSNQGFVGLKRALEYPTNDLFIIQGAHACAVMDEEQGLELFDTVAAMTP